MKRFIRFFSLGKAFGNQTFLLYLLFSFFTTKAQTDSIDFILGKKYLIREMDGTEFFGILLSDDGKELVIDEETKGEIYFKKRDLSLIKLVDSASTNADQKQEDAFYFRYLFSNSGFSTAERKVVRVFSLIGPEVQACFSNGFSLGLTTTWFATPLVFSARYILPKPDQFVHVSFHSIYGRMVYDYMREFGMHGCTFTVGKPHSNFSLGLGVLHYKRAGGREQFIADPTVGILTQKPDEVGVISTRPPTPFVTSFISLSGIKKIAGRSSLIFDSFMGYHKANAAFRSREFISGGNNGQPATYLLVAENFSYTRIFGLLSGGVRIQRKANTALQFSAVLFTRISLQDGYYKHNYSNLYVPLVNLSWMKYF